MNAVAWMYAIGLGLAVAVFVLFVVFAKSTNPN